MGGGWPAQVVLLSDRGPVRFAGGPGELRAEPQSGSVTALLHGISAAAPYPVTWLAPSTSAADEQAMRKGLFRELNAQLGYSVQTVPIDEQEYHGYYYDAGVNLLWTAWHGIEDDVPPVWDARRPLAVLASYTRVNRAMASRVAEVAVENAVVAVQDYQFMLAPAMIRAQRPDVRIAHFSHVPFPDTASVAGLPAEITGTIVNGMLGADLLGFQRAEWAHRFLLCCRRLGLAVDVEHGRVCHRGRDIRVRCYPVTVDVAALADRSATSEVRRWAASTATSDRTFRIARVDRLDPAKNALRGFEAYALLLRRRPELAEAVRFVACLIPSRDQVPGYQRYARKVRQVIEDINLRHPGAIVVHHGNDQDRAFGVLRGYDVLLVNPVADGMNLVALEGPVLNTRNGVVVLSEGAGSADLLSGAVMLAQPRDIGATADALELALSLSPAQRRDRASRMRAAIDGTNSAEWLNHQLADVPVGSGLAGQ